MATGTRAEQVIECFKSLIARMDICGAGAGTVTSTFTLYRRTLVNLAVAPRNDLGIEKRPTKQDFDEVVADEPCIFAGTNPKADRWHVYSEGQFQVELVTLYTAFADIREGDNLLLAFDGKHYLVEASIYAGPLRRCLLNSAKAQMS